MVSTYPVAVAGHSYITRLAREVTSGRFPNNFGLEEFEVMFNGFSGAKIPDLFSNINRILSNNPKVVFLQCGGNDFTGTYSDDHTNIPSQLIALAREIKLHPSVEVVYLGKLFYRGISNYLPTGTSVQRYNRKVDAINRRLDQAVITLRPHQIVVRNHKGRLAASHAILSEDGTHLNPRGMNLFYRSIRGALISSARQLQ